MSEIKIAKRYAKALFSFATEHKKVEEVKADMDYISQLCSVAPDFEKLMKSPVVKVHKKIEIMLALFENKISEISMHYLQIIAKGRRESYIPAIARQYLAFYDERQGLETAELISAIELDNKLKESIKEALSKQTGKTIKLDEKVDKDLIGGFIINLNNTQYDASIRARLNKLHKEFIQ